jgi:RNA polymerase sigma-70 factor (ECF subfamily)
MSDSRPSNDLSDDLRAAWHRYVDILTPLRPALYGYCRRLTGNIWDAEDLVQDTLLRVFGRWGVTYPAIRDHRSYLLRCATNTWIEKIRRREAEARAIAGNAVDAAVHEPSLQRSSEMRDAGSRLLQRLSPQERAAVVLKESFDMSLEEIAKLLATTTGAIKAALHRGRERLKEPEGAGASHRSMPSPQLLDRFIERFNAKDVNGLVALMLEGGMAENVGNSLHVGLDSEEGVPHFLGKVVHGHSEWPAKFQYESRRVERGEFEGEPILMFFNTRRGREALEVVMRIEEQDGHIARIRAYGFCPDTMRALGEAMGIRVRTGIYRAPTPVPGARWPEPDQAKER